MADMRLIKDMSAALNAKPKQPQPYDTTAEVTRVDGNTAWVHIPGGVDETPVQMSVNAKAGDTVRVRVGGGTAWLVGNDTAPPTDDKKANEAQGTADEALNKINTLEAIQIFAEMIQTNSLTVLGDLDGTGYRCEIKEDGIYLINPDGETIAKYGASAQIGKGDGIHVNITNSTISMDTPLGDYLFKIEQYESEVEDGTDSGTTTTVSRFAAGQTIKRTEKIVVTDEYPFKISIQSGAVETYEDYGSYTYGNFTVTLEDDGYSLTNNGSSDITNFQYSTPEYYATHYYGWSWLGNGASVAWNGNINVKTGATVDGVDVSEAASVEGQYVNTSFFATGSITASRKDVWFFIPYSAISGDPVISSLDIVIRTADGGYPYFRSGSTGATYTQIGNALTSVITSGEETRTNEFRSDYEIELIPRSGFLVKLHLTYEVCKDTNGTMVSNNIPIQVNGDISLYLAERA